MKTLLLFTLALIALTLAEGYIPVFFDARDQWKGCIEPVRDQGKCVSSWAHTLAGMVSDRLCILKNTKASLSAQGLISCANESKSCEGKFSPSEIEKMLVEPGLLDNNCFKYQESSDINCPAKCEDGTPLKWYTCSKVNHVEGDIAIKEEILKNGPVVCVTDLYADFKNYYSGVYYYATSKKTPIKHALKIIGWGRENGIFYWTVQTALGSSFGENGFARVKINDKMCNAVLACEP